MPYTLGISSISDTSCKRKRALYIIGRKKKLFFSAKFNIYMYIGKIIHFTIQQLLKNKIQIIEYYYFREKLCLEDCIEIVLRKALEYSYFIAQHKVKFGLFTNADLIEIKNRISNQIESISEEFTKLLVIDMKKKKISTKVIDDEFTVIYEIIKGVLVIGKIDLVCYNEEDNQLEFFEIKSGKLSRRTDANRQLKLYREIYLASNVRRIEHNIKLQLWSTNPGEKEYQGKISSARFDKRSELKKVKDAILKYQNIDSLENLPNRLFKNENTQKICDVCIYCMKEKLILHERKKKDLIDFFENNSHKHEIEEIWEFNKSKIHFDEYKFEGNIKLLNNYIR